MNLWAERVIHTCDSVYAISVDFSKLFNCLSLNVGLAIAGLMGLQPSVIERIRIPLKKTIGCWQMPRNHVSPTFTPQRGLPQGVSSSVTLSELCLSMLLWKIHLAAQVQCVCFVDDLNILARSEDQLTRAMQMLWQYVDSLKLTLSALKSHVWGTHTERLRQLAVLWNVEYRSKLATLGTEWALKRHSAPSCDKELGRVREAKERLRRMQHLPSGVLTKMDAIVIGVNSLVAYSPLPGPSQDIS